ncbi:L,D-transpeptidase family protein [Lacticaseibacillus zhaodongensis]|uniref:L,D-transpeptidase family protein n=1 Tax=Lacticaseibacillus zhaodongensis TaxID=2668065 RepID=UPI0012D3647E|nr:L,D-transpeptidase [Lacticaseibacillus zhaodongensis]
MKSIKIIRLAGLAATLALATAGLHGQAVQAATTSAAQSSQQASATSASTTSAADTTTASTASTTTAASDSSSSKAATTATATAKTQHAASTATAKTSTPALSGLTVKTGSIKLPSARNLQTGPGKSYSVIKPLAAGSTWKYFAVRDYQGYFWYNLGGNQWVSVSKTAPAAAPSSNVVSKKGTIKLPINAALQNGAGNGYRVVKQLKAGSSWKYFAIRSNYEGKNWYNVGGNQWVGIRPGQKPAATTLSGVVKRSGTLRLNAKRNLQAGPGKGYRVIKSLAYGSKWKYFAVRYYQGLTWYNLGGNNWVSINPATVDWHGPSEVDHAYPNLNAYRNVWVKVSLSKQRVYLMSGNTVLYTMLCSTGRPGDATPTGTYAIQRERGPVFGGSLGGARYYVSWKDHGVYLFHSVPINGRGQYLAQEGALLGKRPHSHGCIRLTVSDAYWMYTHIKYGTKVVVQH